MTYILFAMLACVITLQVTILLTTASKTQTGRIKTGIKEMGSDLCGRMNMMDHGLDRIEQRVLACEAAAIRAERAMKPATLEAICRGMSENTYSMMKSLISAVEENDVSRLSDVVRAAKHMCGQYELAAKARDR